MAGGRVSRRNDPEREFGFFKTEGLTTDQLRQAVIHARQSSAAKRMDGSSERRTCRVVGLSRSTHQYQKTSKDEGSLRLALIRLAKQYGRGACPGLDLGAIGRSPNCSGSKAGISITSALRGSGVRKGSSCLSVTRNGKGSITTTARSSAYVLGIRITSGAWILSMTV